MAKTREQMGEGTLYDTDGNELATVAYKVSPFDDGDERSWGGELFFRDEQMTVDPGLYVLALEDGTEIDVQIEPTGSTDGDRRHVRFNGVGTFGQRIV